MSERDIKEYETIHMAPTSEYAKDRYEAIIITKGASDSDVSHFADFEIFENQGSRQDTIGTGFIKWDGCMETKLNVHTCSLNDVIELDKFRADIYKKAGEAIDSADPGEFE